MSNIDYLDTYLARINKLGANHKERELNASIIEFEKYLTQHPSSENIVVNGNTEVVSIISNKQDETKMTKKILARLDSELIPGSLFTWNGDTWIVYFQETNPNEAYHSNLAVRCNEIIKWINEYGVLRQSPCYVVGNMMSTIKNNFRTWNSTITPLPNQFLDLITPYIADIKLGQKFLIDSRAWIIVEYDTISVPGIMYISLTEDKVDRQQDNLALAVANYDELNSYTIELTTSDIEVVMGTNYNIFPIVKYKGQVLSTAQVGYEIVDETVASATNIIGGAQISGITIGATSLRISLEGANVYLDVPLVVVASGTKTPECVISGPDIIKLGMTGEYVLYEVTNTEEQLAINSFTADKTGYVTGTIANGILTLTANVEGLVGSVIISLIHDGPPELTALKTITIKSLW